MVYQIAQYNLLNNIVYRAACLTTYLAYRLKFTDKSANDLAFESVIETVDSEPIRDKDKKKRVLLCHQF